MRMQVNKSIKIFLNYVLGPVLFIWLAFSVYHQISRQSNITASWEHIQRSFYSHHVGYLSAVVILMCINWGLEARKWQLSVRAIYPLRFLQAFKAILSGVSFSVTTPNRVGEYIGRMLYLPEGSRLKTISVTVVGSISQLIITVSVGVFGLMALEKPLMDNDFLNAVTINVLIVALATVAVVLLIVYLRIDWVEHLFERWLKNSRFLYLVQSLQTFNVQLLYQLLLLSFLRYLVFIAQYYLLFVLFDVPLSFLLISAVVSVLFLTMAVIPTIALVEIGLRGEIGLQLMGMFTANSLGVGLTLVSIWLINLVIPAILGSALILGIKAFNRRDETG